MTTKRLDKKMRENIEGSRTNWTSVVYGKGLLEPFEARARESLIG
jgi:hypothetical protein